MEPITVTDKARRVVAPFKPWFNVTVVNDGPDDVLVTVNVEKSVEWHRMIKGESYQVNMNRGVIKDVLLKCEPNKAASVRLVGTR